MQPSGERIWTAAQEQLRTMLSGDTFNLWFAPLRVCGVDDKSLQLEVANDFCEVWLKENYMSLLQDVVAMASGKQLQIRFKIASAAPTLTPVIHAPAPAPVPKAKHSESNDKAAAPLEL